MRPWIGVALTIVFLATVAVSRVQAAPRGQADEVPGDVWLQNHAEVTLWSDDAESGLAFGIVPQFL